MAGYGPGGAIANGAYTGGGGMAAGLGGFGALGIPALMSFAPALIQSLFGDPQQKLRKQIMKLQGPQNVGRLTNQFYQNNLSSPAYSQAQGTIAAGANQAGNQLAANLGARGIGTSGSAAVLSSLIPSLVGSQQAGLRTDAFNAANQQAQQQIAQQIQLLMGTQGPSPTQQMFGAGLASFAPFLEQFLRNRYPGTFGSVGG